MPRGSREDDGHPLPCQRHFPGVNEGQGKHPPKTRHTVGSPLLIGVDQRLRIRPRPKAVTQPLQRRAQVTEVVDLAVERHPDGPVLVAHGLVTAGERSRMLRRRFPRTTRPRNGLGSSGAMFPAPSTQRPPPSGPRWCIAATIVRTGSTGSGTELINPAMPHIGSPARSLPPGCGRLRRGRLKQRQELS